MQDAAGNTDGILPNQDDNDDAIGSFHQACIVDSALTNPPGTTASTDYNSVVTLANADL